MTTKVVLQNNELVAQWDIRHTSHFAQIMHEMIPLIFCTHYLRVLGAANAPL